MLVILADGWSQDPHDRSIGLGPIADRVQSELLTAACFLVSCSTDIAALVQSYAGIKEPIVIVGYSYGGSKAIDACWKLAAMGIQVDQLITLDPVPRWWRGQLQNVPIFGSQSFGIPDNVHAASNLFKAQGVLHGLPIRIEPGRLTIAGTFGNECLDGLFSSHADLPDNTYVQTRIFNLIENVGLTTERTESKEATANTSANSVVNNGGSDGGSA